MTIQKNQGENIRQTHNLKSDCPGQNVIRKRQFTENEQGSSSHRCIYTNAQSFLSKKSEIENYVQHNTTDIIFLTETWMTELHSPSEHNLIGYQNPITSYNARGGTSIYVKTGIVYSEVEPPSKFPDSTWIEMLTKERKRRVYACIYRSPNADQNDNEKLLHNVKWAAENFNEAVLVGDFNLPTIEWVAEEATGRFAKSFLEVALANSFEQLVEEPTRHRAGQQSSLLDLVITNQPECISDITHQAPLGKSDHEVLEFSIINGLTNKQYFPVKYNYRKMDVDTFSERLRQDDWKHMIETNQFDYKFLMRTVTEATERTTPTIKARDRKKAPWSTKLIEKLAKKKRKCWHKYKGSGLHSEGQEKERYMSALQTFNAARNEAIRDYELNIVNNKTRNQKRYYSYLARNAKYRDPSMLLQDSTGSEHSDIDECGKILNNYFREVFTKGTSNTMPPIKTPRVINDMPEVIFSEQKVLEKLNKLNVAKACGPDDIPAVVLRKASDAFAPILSKLFEKTYEEGQIPLEMKMANVTPIHKGGSKKNPAHYRPVSVTPVTSKVQESIMYDVLYQHVEENNVITPVQHGFQRGKSTTTNMLEFWDAVSRLADQTQPVSIIYTDLRKAFDTVPHDLLLHKLEHYGIRGKNLAWFADYLRNRQQRVVINGHASPFVSVKSGVPQGGTLSGLLFIIYINDLPMYIEYCQVSMYADDTKLFAPISEATGCGHVQDDINNLCQYCQDWRLNLNGKKCFVVQYNPRNSNVKPKYTINGEEVQQKDCAADLGVNVSQDFKFHRHIDHVCNKGKREIGRIKRSFKSRTPRFLSDTYKTYVRPHIEYTVPVWNPEYELDKRKLESVQNRFTRMLRYGSVMTPDERNEMLGLTTHETRRFRGDMIQMYKFSKDGSLEQKPDRGRRSHSKAVKIERNRTNIRAHSFYPRSAKNWNALPENVVSSQTINEFKDRIDEYIKQTRR